MDDAALDQLTSLVKEHTIRPDTVEITDGEQTHEVLVLPNGDGGFVVKSAKELLAEYRDRPERRKGTAKLTELASFIEHVNRFKDTDSVIFADRNASKPALHCVLDYHRTGAEGEPRFGCHVARYEFPLADEWRLWKERNAVPFSQRDFAAFMEDHLCDVVDPKVAGQSSQDFADMFACKFATPGQVLTLSKGLHIHQGREVANKPNLQTGEDTLVFTEKHSDAAGKQLTIPGAFLLGIPVFRGGERYQIPARLRYEIQGTDVTWRFSLHRPDAAFDVAVKEACEEASQETELPLLYGTPEA